jgi:gliding motility-associated protein GldE
MLSAFISGTEVALFSLSQKDIDDITAKEPNKGNLIENLLDKPKKLLATILVANNFVNIGVVILFATLSERFFGGITLAWLRFVVEVIIITFLILLFGEVLPKIYASRNNIKFSKQVALPITIVSNLLSFVTIPMRNITLFIEKKFGKQKSNLSVDQLSQALELTDQRETSHNEQKILEGIVSFGNTEVKQVMSPRIDLFALDIDETFDEIMPKILDKGYSRIPIFQDSIDHIQGILFVKDLLPYIEEEKNFDWKTLVREPFFIPENKKLDNLLKEFQTMKNHLAIVVDEYGGTSGIITLEDIIEEIVGDISDEFDELEKNYTKISENTFLFEGKISLKDFYKITNADEAVFETAKGEAETLAGFLLEIAGNFPKKGQTLTFENYNFTIEMLDKRRITQIKTNIKND